jgi:hypothetical protein
VEHGFSDDLFLEYDVDSSFHGFHLSFPPSTKVRSAWQVELECYPLFGQLLIQVAGHRFEGLSQFSVYFNNVCTIVRKMLERLALTCNEVSYRHQEGIGIQALHGFQVGAAAGHAFVDDDPSLSIVTSQFLC